jgi:hypothetical protein
MTKTAVLALVLLAGLPAASAHSPAEPLRPVLRGTQCLDPDFARGWTHWDDRTSLVDAGRKKYRVEFQHRCWGLDWSHVLAFRGDPISGRVCGGAFDAVLTRDVPCPIGRMDLISKEEYQAMLDDRARERAERRRVRRNR